MRSCCQLVLLGQDLRARREMNGLRFAKPEQHTVESTEIIIVALANCQCCIICLQVWFHRLNGIRCEHQCCCKAPSLVQSGMGGCCKEMYGRHSTSIGPLKNGKATSDSHIKTLHCQHLCLSSAPNVHTADLDCPPSIEACHHLCSSPGAETERVGQTPPKQIAR